MKTNDWLRELPFVLLIALPWMVFLYLADSLPAQVPSHYSISSNGWVVDSWMSPSGFVTTTTLVTLFLYLVMTVSAYFFPGKLPWLYYFKLALILFFDAIAICTIAGSNMDITMFSNLVMLGSCAIINGFVFWLFKYVKKVAKEPIFPKYYNIIWAGTHFIITLPLILIIFSRQNWVGHRTIPQAVLLFFAVLANLTYNVKPNRFIGIRTPWTLADEEIWRKTNRVCSKWFFIVSLAGFVISVFAPEQWIPRVMIIVPLFCAGSAMIYSYWLYKKRGSM
ncbi:SdpI family protein [Chitinophaga sancti]|uniref:SdpI family protein n=1 Tax=Chitinophaga sancti TaxID=1004 RepID=A0A1K1SQJ9_9BACT|nr:SdpI family protein [Chitinophaga sancti]WQD61041.1 SdpI family protein [Chitinophaga sancti]WQG86830.1 SdpI family protein [Chitinophaga sancti]SFW86593.1 Uncharacterized membrane protein [Chitinophaga sancti]